jgi:hypothetical protein
LFKWMNEIIKEYVHWTRCKLVAKDWNKIHHIKWMNEIMTKHICWISYKIVGDKLENIRIKFIHQMNEWNN